MLSSKTSKRFISFNPIPPGGGGGGGRGGAAESARADFNFRELPWYVSNTYQMWPLLPKFIGEQDSAKILRQGYTCCHGNHVFETMFTQILTF